MKAQGQEHWCTTLMYSCSKGKQSFGEWQHSVPLGHNAALIAPSAPASWGCWSKNWQTKPTLHCICPSCPRPTATHRTPENRTALHCSWALLNYSCILVVLFCLFDLTWLCECTFFSFESPPPRYFHFSHSIFPLLACYLGSVTQKEMVTASTQIIL